MFYILEIYEVDVGLPENFEGIISAYGDFNGDKAYKRMIKLELM